MSTGIIDSVTIAAIAISNCGDKVIADRLVKPWLVRQTLFVRTAVPLDGFI